MNDHPVSAVLQPDTYVTNTPFKEPDSQELGGHRLATTMNPTTDNIDTPETPEASPVSREVVSLPPGMSGETKEVTVIRFGQPGAQPKAYLQAGLHADELPGMLVLRELATLLETAASSGKIMGEIILVPVANPIGLAQRDFGILQGRFDAGSGVNFNREYPDLAAGIAQTIGLSLSEDPMANIAAIRSAMGAMLADMSPESELAALRHALLKLAHDADIVLDLHTDNEAQMHLYTGSALWPDAADLAADIDARAVLLCEESGGDPFDEACSSPWWKLASSFPDYPIPAACLAATVELRSSNDVEERQVRDDAAALMRFLARRGLVAESPGTLPRLLCEATELTAMQQVIADTEGVVVYCAQLGDLLREGDVVANIIDPLGESTQVVATTEGRLFARHDQRYAWPGKIIGKIAGATPLPERAGNLLTE